jgi:hypothetical protein
MRRKRAPFIVELTTRAGRVCERYGTYEEARRRVEQVAAEEQVGLAYIFEELPDGSERLVREDGKPLQFHRSLVDDVREAQSDPAAPLPLAEDSSSGVEGKIQVFELPEKEPWDDEV